MGRRRLRQDLSRRKTGLERMISAEDEKRENSIYGKWKGRKRGGK
jgi:hypothetical protein